MVDGWPERVGRPNWGPDMREEKRQKDPSNSLNMEQMNLLFWQMGGISLSAPKAVMLWTPPGSVELTYGLFSWDDTIYQNVDVPSLPAVITSYVVNGLGDYTLTFDNQVLGRHDANGVQQLEALNFQYAVANVNLTTDGRRAFANATLLTPQSIQVQILRDAALEHQPYALAVY